MKGKKGNILIENVIFIVLNLVFFLILIGFILLQSSSSSLYEQKTAKQIALILDASKPGTEIKLNIEEALDKKDRNVVNPIIIDDEKNIVIIRLTEESYYEYGFFNDLDVFYSIDKKYLTMEIK